MSEPAPSTKEQIKAALIGWGVPSLMSAVPLIAYFNAVADTLRLLGWRFVTVMFSSLLFVLGRALVSLHKASSRISNLTGKLDDDFRKHLKPVPGRGYCIDTRFNEPVCPVCDQHGHEAFMRFLPARLPYAHDVLMCDVCKHIIGLDSCSAKATENIAGNR